MRPKHLAILIVVALIWGASFVFIKLAVQTPAAPYNFPPLTLVGIRLGLAALLMYGVLKQQGGSFAWSQWRGLAVIGLLNAALPYFLFSWSGVRIDSNLASIYNATTPLWTVILVSIFVREERLSLLRSMGIVVGFLGIVYLFSGSFTDGALNTGKRYVPAELACVFAAFCYGVSNTWARSRLKNLSAMQLATGQMLFGSLWTVPLIVTVEQPWRTLSPSVTALLSLLTLSVLGTAIAMLLYFQLMAEVGATRTTQVTYLLPICGLFWGWVLGETITTRVVGALVIVMIGVAIVNGVVERVFRRKPVAVPSAPLVSSRQLGDGEVSSRAH
ncbi:MAG TPA: DMT family transporter [Herpetosiphonaceae bacterium]